MSLLLHDLVRTAARTRGDAVAVVDEERAWTYTEVDEQADRLARRLAALPVGPGSRAALWMPKSGRTVVAMQAVLRLNAAYVPIDPIGPVDRTVRIIGDCAPDVVVTTSGLAALLRDRPIGCPVLCIDGPDEPADPDDPAEPAGRAGPHDEPGRASPDDLAYVLYTSGSTGTPKGVCISHRNALAFVEWAAGEVGVTADDRLSGHAPFHFDLSVFDLYVAFWAGASVHLVPAETAYAPRRLVDLVEDQGITVWYSVPSALILMCRDGGFLDARPSRLRAVLFAGEPYPVQHLRRLRDHLPGVRLLNLYGPTETNVCTFFEVTDIPEDRTEPMPIGRACSGDRVWAARPDGTAAAVGEEGELVVDGPTVMLGYFGHEPQHGRPYRTGDRVVLSPDGDFRYRGRQDGMVKVRGHRVELGEIESAVSTHPDVDEAAVVVVGSGVDAILVLYVVPEPARSFDLLSAKRHCARTLPRHMIVDAVRELPRLPRTPNGKVDRRSLVRTASDAFDAAAGR